MIRFIDEYRNRFTIEFICTTLKNNREGGFITPRGYRLSKARRMSARRLRDTALLEHLRHVHADNYGVYGVRIMWHALCREGIAIGREQTARLMRMAVLSGLGKGGDLSPPARPKVRIYDLNSLIVNSKHRDQENCGWLTLTMYGHEKDSSTPLLSPTCTPAGSSVGHYLIRCALQVLPLQTLNQAIVCAQETTGLVHHSDHGSQYVSVVYNERLAQHGITASTGTVGDSYDNALAENVNGSYKR